MNWNSTRIHLLRSPHAPIALALGALAFALGAACSSQGVHDPSGIAAGWSHGERLFAKHCALCHGERGDGEGAAAPILFPRPRDFTRGTFKMASTRNGVPTNEDLHAVLERGMPGSSMPSWSWMSRLDREALVQHVRRLAVEGIREELEAEEPDAPVDELLARATRRMDPDPPIRVGPAAAMDAATIARGRELFVTHCSGCHGGDARARLARPDADGTLNRARDLRLGILRGGLGHEELARRIQVGIHGTAMSAGDLSTEDRATLVAYVRSIVPEDSLDRYVQRRRRIRARRIEGELPLEPRDPVWEELPAEELAFAPLWWNEDALLEASVSALHDGRRIGVRLRWSDPTADAPEFSSPPYATPPYADAVALQLTSDEDPAFFGMGPATPDSHEPSATNIWHWRSVPPLDSGLTAKGLRLLAHQIRPWMPTSSLAALPHYRVGHDPSGLMAEGRAVAASGMRRLDEQAPIETSLEVRSRWEDGEWWVVLSRELEPGEAGEIPLAPGDRRLVNFALWNGAAKDLRGQKSVTIWHELVLDE